MPCEPSTTEGVPMRVLVGEPAGGSLARCADVGGSVATVETVLVGAVERGDVVLVHSGVALVRLDAEWTP
ncbi:MAG TPA: HypC/HybG/HupF family hydrogenase formation chaperone [Conexibacter sp.]|nr:HypC/HybG/HupF family hydrogenase formation chaperone [Conexibacter sp.]